jgi:hypothetical protein
MSFSRLQWLEIIVLDVSLKAVYFLVFSLSPFALPVAALYTALHLTSFVVARACLRRVQLSYGAHVTAILFMANLLFAAVSIFLWVSNAGRVRLTECFGIERTCHFVEGVVTPAGFQIIVLKTGIYIALNLIPFFIVMTLAICSNRRMLATKS